MVTWNAISPFESMSPRSPDTFTRILDLRAVEANNSPLLADAALFSPPSGRAPVSPMQKSATPLDFFCVYRSV
jgi:hypothetical protein